MTQNIEQRTLAATTTLESSAKTVDEIAHTDKVVETPVGQRKSFPKIAKEWDDESTLLKQNWQQESKQLKQSWENDSTTLRSEWKQERDQFSVKSLGVKPWESGVEESNLNQQRRWTDGHTYLPKSVPLIMSALGPDDNWIPFSAERADMLRDVYGQAPLDLIENLNINPNAVNQYPKLSAFGFVWELPDGASSFTVSSFSINGNGNLSITLNDNSTMIAKKVISSSRHWVDEKLGNELAKSIVDQSGRAGFDKDGFEVELSGGKLRVNPGVGYVSGIKIIQPIAEYLDLPMTASSVFVDVWRESSDGGELSTHHLFSVSDSLLLDYVDANGNQHYLCELALFEDNSVKDLRPKFVSSKRWQKGDVLLSKDERRTFQRAGHLADGMVFFAPFASKDNPVTLGDDPLSDKNLYQFNQSAGCNAGTYPQTVPIVVSHAKKLSGMGRTTVDGIVTKLIFADDGMVIGGGYVNGADIDDFYLYGSGVGVGLNLNGTIDLPVNDSTLKKFRVENFAVGFKSSYAWSNSLETIRAHNCQKSFEINSQSNNMTFNVFNASGAQETSTFKNAEGIVFNSFNFVNQSAATTMSLFQSYVTIHSPYFENVSGSVLVGTSSEVNPSSLILNGGLIAGDFIVGSDGVHLELNGCRNAKVKSKINSSSGLPVKWANIKAKTVCIGNDVPDIDFLNWHLFTTHEKAILWPNSSGGGVRYAKLYRDYYTFEQAADLNGMSIADDLIIGQQYCLVMAVRRETLNMPISVRSGTKNISFSNTAIPNSDDDWVIRHFPFVAEASDLKLLFKGVLQIKMIAISNGVADTGSVSFPDVKRWRGSSAPLQGDWLAGDMVDSEVESINGFRCSIGGSPGTWVQY